jgi:putative phage-type endonuclease
MKTLSLNQGTETWRRWRRNGVGGSDVATILGLAPFEDATRANLLREKCDGWQKPLNFAMRRGNRLEPAARLAYETRFRTSAPPACIEHDSIPWARVSLDGLCKQPVTASLRDAQCDTGHGLPWILELKCPNWETHSWALAGVVPDYYRVQCQYQMWVAGIDRCDFASYSEHSRFAGENRLAVVTLREDAEEQAEILTAAEAFWQEVCARRDAKQNVGVA